jgi:hypothetical protein
MIRCEMSIQEVLMAQLNDYEMILVESFFANNTSGKRGKIHIRPVAGNKYSVDLHVACSKSLSDPKQFKVGTKFSLQAKLTDRESGGKYLYSHPRWKYCVIT